MKEALRKIFSILVLFVYVLNTIGGTGYLFYYLQPFMAVCNLAVSAMAFPYAKQCLDELLK